MLFGDDSARAVCGIPAIAMFRIALSALAMSGNRRTDTKGAVAAPSHSRGGSNISHRKAFG